MASYSGFDSVTLCAPAGDCFPGTPSPSEPITTPIKTPITTTTTAPSHCACHHPPPTPYPVPSLQIPPFLFSDQAMSKTTTTTTAHDHNNHHRFCSSPLSLSPLPTATTAPQPPVAANSSSNAFFFQDPHLLDRDHCVLPLPANSDNNWDHLSSIILIKIELLD